MKDEGALAPFFSGGVGSMYALWSIFWSMVHLFRGSRKRIPDLEKGKT